MSPVSTDAGRQWRLPPLILHPFSDRSGPDKLAESSRASLMLQGLAPNEEFSMEELHRRLLEGRFYEVRMLFYVGKDLARWIDQCVDFVSRDDTLQQTGIAGESFAAMLVEDPPASVRQKLQNWGVTDYKSIFARALGLNTVFAIAPERESLSDEFIRHHYRYAEHLFACRQGMRRHARIRSANFQFELYASGEYARLLERQWEE
jgi:hypothetical protein